MDRRQRNTFYARILTIGLGISVAVHVAVIGLGRLNFLARGPANSPLTVITLPEPEQEETQAESSLGWQLALNINLEDGEFPTVLELSEYDDVLADAASADLSRPLVPRPHLRAERAESGFTPIRVPQADRFTRRGGSGEPGSGAGLGGVIIVVGGGGFGPIDDCMPSGGTGRFPTGRRPGRR